MLFNISRGKELIYSQKELIVNIWKVGKIKRKYQATGIFIASYIRLVQK